MLWILFLAFMGAATPAAAQTATDTRVWTMMSVRGRTSTTSPWRWAADSLIGTREGAGRLDRLVGQLTLTRDLTTRSSVGASYAFGAAFPDSGRLREHRLAQQFTWRVGARPRLTVRSALEERFVSGRDTAWRADQYLRVTLPVAARGRLSAVTSNEVFVPLSELGPSPKEIDNRTLVGIAVTLTTRTQVEMGYLHLYARRASSSPTHSHILVVSVAVSR